MMRRLVACLALGCLWGGRALAAPVATHEGQPITRAYPFEEIGEVSRGGRLTFDRFGRLAVVQDGSYLALNDNDWTNLATRDDRHPILQATTAPDGTTYYGALGDWGRLIPAADGKLYAESLAPRACPEWVAATNFTNVLITSDRIYFAGWNGVAVWNWASHTHQFVAVPELSRLFEADGKIYVSSIIRGVSVLDPATATLVPAAPGLRELIVGDCARFGSGDTLVVTLDRRLLRWHDGQATALPGPLRTLLSGPTLLQSLVGGDVAVAVSNVGLFIVDAGGAIKLALTHGEYGRITALAANEPGVLWAATETAIVKIFYENPLSVFGQSLGINVAWPQLVAWDGHVVVASGGHVYQSVATGPGEPMRFERMADDPGPGAWGIATVGRWLLSGNPRGVFACEPGQAFQPVLGGIDAARLAATASGLCYVVGPKQIAVLRCINGVWTECAPRIDGVGFPAIVHAAADSVWIELGVNRAARVTFADGRLHAQIFQAFPWRHPDWVNISAVGPTVMLTVPDAQPLYFDETTGRMTDAPPWARALARCPSPVVRVEQDDSGTLWASLVHGIIRLPAGDDRPVTASSYELNNEATPRVQPLPHQDIWVTTGNSLYHLNTHRALPPPAAFHPTLVSIRDSRRNVEILSGPAGAAAPPRFTADENSLTLTFFAGSYRSRRPPHYEYRLDGRDWMPSTSDSSIALTDLREGAYHLEVRLADARGPLGTPAAFDFSVAPPWYRTWFAILGYPVLVALLLFALVRYSVRRAEARSVALERVVAQRTAELKTTMEKLQQETQTAATLAERNRLAGEIHDSLEQGFTGLQLQLETTASFPACPQDVKSGLTVALNMVAYSRNEVRHAVRNLHSPILESADLTTALRHVVTQIAPEPNYATVSELGAPRRLGSTTEHHLLRIAQEAITNAVKHSRATHVEVAINYGADEVMLSIRDNGCGFDPASVFKSEIGHFGLPSFRGRASAIGGTVEITSNPGGGTSILVRVPVTPPFL